MNQYIYVGFKNGYFLSDLTVTHTFFMFQKEPNIFTKSVFMQYTCTVHNITLCTTCGGFNLSIG